MAVVAVIAAADVCRVFACCDGAVVTGTANTDDLRVVHGIGRGPLHVVVAIAADIGCRYMGRWFAGGAHPIMATATVIENV